MSLILYRCPKCKQDFADYNVVDWMLSPGSGKRKCIFCKGWAKVKEICSDTKYDKYPRRNISNRSS